MPLQLSEGEDYSQNNDYIRLRQSWKERWCEVILMGKYVKCVRSVYIQMFTITYVQILIDYISEWSFLVMKLKKATFIADISLWLLNEK